MDKFLAFSVQRSAFRLLRENPDSGFLAFLYALRSSLNARAFVSLSKIGLSMIELVIALAILTIGLVGAMQVFPVGLRASQRSEASSRVVMAAQRVVESLKLEPWDQLPLGEVEVLEPEFEVEVTIVQPEATLLADATRLKTAEVRLQWKQDSKIRETHFLTYLKKPTDED